MPAFRFTAIDAGGQLVRGTIDAENKAEVIARLQRQGSIPMRAEPDGGGLSGIPYLRPGRAAMRQGDVAAVTRELAVMLGAGQDLDRALRFLVETAPNKRVRATMDAVRSRVRDGSSLATALSDHPGSFGRLFLGLVRAGEAGGTLAATLERLAELMERERSLLSTVRSAMIYPSLLLLVAIGSVAMLLTTVLPQFVPLFEQSGAALPGATQFMIDAGAFLQSYGLLLLLGILLALLAARTALRRPGPRLWADRALLRLPVAGGLLRELAAARFTRTLGTLLDNGVPLIGALGIVRNVVGNTQAVAAIESATVAAKGGAGLSRPLANSAVFPARTIHLLRLGEETAQLGAMALRAAAIHEEAVRLGVGRLVALLVPGITIVMGAVVAAIVSALLLAMLGLNDLAAG